MDAVVILFVSPRPPPSPPHPLSSGLEKRGNRKRTVQTEGEGERGVEGGGSVCGPVMRCLQVCEYAHMYLCVFLCMYDCVRKCVCV